MRLRSYMPAVTALGVLAVTSAPAFAGTKTLTTPETLKLDAHRTPNVGYAGPVKTASALQTNKLYVATVSGLVSYYAATSWTGPKKAQVICGTPAAGVNWQSAGVVNGKAGMDAEFVFARPWTAQGCARHPLPLHWGNFQRSTSAGWRHPAVIGGSPAAPASDHTYNYALKGGGGQISFRLADVWTPDNYGKLKIVVRRATTADCATNGWQAFGSVSEADCDTHLVQSAT